jgi:hypothetical protein
MSSGAHLTSLGAWAFVDNLASSSQFAVCFDSFGPLFLWCSVVAEGEVGWLSGPNLQLGGGVFVVRGRLFGSPGFDPGPASLGLILVLFCVDVSGK